MPSRGVSTWRRPYTSIYNDNFRYGTGLYSDTLSDIEKRYSESLNKTQLRSDRPDLAFTTFSGSNLTSSPNPVSADRSSRENAITFSRRPLVSPSPTPEITRSPTFENRLNATLKSAASALGEDVEEAVNARIERRKQAIARQMSESKTTNEEDDDDFARRLEIRKKAIARQVSESKMTNEEDDDDYARRLEIRKKAIARVMSSSEVKSKSSDDSEEYVSKSSKKTTTEQQPLRPTSLYDDADLWTLPKKSNKLDLDIPKTRKKEAGGLTTTTNGPSSSRWREKSRTLQDQVDSLEKSMSDGSSRLKNELSSLKSKYHSELYDLSGSVENTTQQASDLQRICSKQETQLKELQTAYGSAQRNIEDVLEEMNLWQNKCKSLKKEMDRLREEVEMAVSKKSKA